MTDIYNKSIYFDIQMGASGDMLLGALFDLGLNYNELMQKLSLPGVSNWEINPEKTVRQSLSGILANVKCKEDKGHRNLKDINKLITDSRLPETVKSNTLKIFRNLASAEAKVHGKSIDQIHFHEIGAVDSIIDITAFCIAVDILKIKNIYFNEFHFGTGTISSAHGEIPLPVPAVAELTKGYKSKITNKPGELITPTAAAILTTLGKQADNLSYSAISSGIGFGTREYGFPSYTRAFLIEPSEETENIKQLECNIDDMNPQLFPDVLDKLLKAGALDAYIGTILMKKGRPGYLISVIAETGKVRQLKEILYENTTTLGIRIFNIEREKLSRKYETITVLNQNIRIKIGYYNNKRVNIQPEFEDCKKAADKLNIPLKEVQLQAINEYIAGEQNNSIITPE